MEVPLFPAASIHASSPRRRPRPLPLRHHRPSIPRRRNGDELYCGGMDAGGEEESKAVAVGGVDRKRRGVPKESEMESLGNGGRENGKRRGGGGD